MPRSSHFFVRIFNELTQIFEAFPLNAEIVETLAHPLVIGLMDIRKHKLAQKWPTFFVGEDLCRKLSTSPSDSAMGTAARRPTGLSSRTTASLLCIIRSDQRRLYAKAYVLMPLPDYDYLNPRQDETPSWVEPPQSVDEKLSSVHIEHFKDRHKALL